MTWSMQAAGHTPDEATERQLADKLSQILAEPKYGASMSSFGGNYVHGDLRTRENWLGPALTEHAELHPATAAILRHFAYDHLPAGLAEISKHFHDLAHRLASELGGPELTASLRKLLEAKDCAVRAALPF